MYNPEQKQRFINSKDKAFPIQILERIFRMTEKYENENGKDISEFTDILILDFYKSLNISVISSLDTMHSQLKMYTQWCLSEHLLKDGQNHYNTITVDQRKNCLNLIKMEMKVLTRNIILEWCRDLPNDMDAFALLALFEIGKSKDQQFLLKMKVSDFEDINAPINQKKLKLLDGRVVSVSDDLVNYALKANEADRYYSMSGQKERYSYLNDRGFIIKGCVNSSSDISEYMEGRRFYNRFSKALDYFGYKDICNANNISNSGKVHFINTNARELKMNGVDYVYTHLDKINHQFCCPLVPHIFVKNYENVLYRVGHNDKN